MEKRRFRGGWAVLLVVALSGCGKKEHAEKSVASAASSAPAGAGSGGGASLALLSGFEGEIGLVLKGSSKGRGGSETVPLTLQVKADKVRVDIPPGVGGDKPAPKGYAILNTPEKKLSMVMDEQRQVIVIDLDKGPDQLKSFASGLGGQPPGRPEPAGKPTKAPPKLTKTGVTDKVAGYACENWEVTDEGRKIATLCIADQGASWLKWPAAGVPSEYAWASELMDGHHFPLRAVGYGEQGAEDGRVEVTKLEKKAIAPALFEPPAGYKVIDLAAMMQGMPALGRMGGAPGAPGVPPFALPPKKPK